MEFDAGPWRVVGTILQKMAISLWCRTLLQGSTVSELGLIVASITCRQSACVTQCV